MTRFPITKRLFLSFTLLTTLIALPTVAGAKDKDKDRDHDHYYSDRDKKAWKEMRDDIRELREQYDRLVETVRREGASRKVREEMSYLGADVQRTSVIFERGDYDYRDMKARISRVYDSLEHTRDHVRYEQKNRDRYR